MTANLYWEPIIEPKRSLSDELKYALRKRFDIERGQKQRLDESDINYLSGLKDGGVKGTDELIEAIKKHGEVEIFEKA